MLINTFILYKNSEFIEAEIVIKDAVIKEINFNTFKNLYPEENNSEASRFTEIKKVHHPERIQNGCKYYIQHSFQGEVMNVYLDINRLQYFNLMKQLFIKNVIKTKEFAIGLILAFVAALFTLFQ